MTMLSKNPDNDGLSGTIAMTCELPVRMCRLKKQLSLVLRRRREQSWNVMKPPEQGLIVGVEGVENVTTHYS